MINDYASLKSGVAIKLIETRGLEIAEGIQPALLDINKYHHIISAQDTQLMLQAVTRLFDYAMKYIKNDLDRNNGLIDITNTSSYQPVGKDVEVNIEDDTVNSLLFRIYTVLDSIDAGGKPLSSISLEKNSLLSLKLWIMVLDIWGSYLPIESININLTRINAVEKLQESIIELKQIFTDHEYSTSPIIIDICKEAKILEKSFAKILVYLKNQIPNTVNSSDSSREFDEVCTFRHHFEYDKAGYLLPLSCGHSGHFSNAEIALLETHLTRISFIK